MSIFNSIRIKKPKRTAFDLSHDVKLSCNMGSLVPVFCQQVVPGDTFKVNTETLIRFAPLQAPVMHKINVYMHYFFVPNRLIWDGWQDFITGGEDGESDRVYPRIRLTAASYGTLSKVITPGSLADFLGFPTIDPPGPDTDLNSRPITGIYDLDALPFRAYNLIWNDYYRDQNLTEEVDIMKDSDGIITFPNSSLLSLLMLRNRCWSKDYFTSALPFPQRGEDVMLPLYGDADIVGNVGSYSVKPYTPVTPDYVEVFPNGTAPGTITSADSGDTFVVGNDGGLYVKKPDGTIGSSASIYNNGVAGTVNLSDLSKKLKVDLSTASASTINELRRAMRAQEFLEVGARGGSRYIEQIRSYFGVKSSDSRLQRPEFLGGGKQPVVISDVVQTSQTTESSPQATPAGAAASLGKTNSFKRFFEEHGYVIGIMSVLPVPAYQQGLPRQFQKFDRFDYYWPQFAHLGEQEIKNSEIYFDFKDSDGSDSYNEGTFGYTPRYAEYKFIPSSVHGDFKTTLNYWHLGRIFGSKPNLNTQFVTYRQDNGSDRVFAVEDPDYNKLWVNIHHNFKAIRPMPKYGTPLL